MLKSLFFTSALMLASIAAFADDAAQPAPKPEHPHGGFMQNLTEEQRNCIKEFGCKMPERPARPEGASVDGAVPPADAAPQKPEPGKMPEMTPEQKENMECMRKAMESCGVEMPKRPERPDGNPPADQPAPAAE